MPDRYPARLPSGEAHTFETPQARDAWLRACGVHPWGHFQISDRRHWTIPDNERPPTWTQWAPQVH